MSWGDISLAADHTKQHNEFGLSVKFVNIRKKHMKGCLRIRDKIQTHQIKSIYQAEIIL